MNTERESRFARAVRLLLRRRLRRAFLRSAAWRATAALGSAALLASAGASTAGPNVPPDADRLPLHGEPGFVFASVEAAAIDALAHAHRSARADDEGRFRVGTIRRVEGGFTYSAATAAGATVWQSRRSELRYALAGHDVATFIVHPRSGDARVDRANETPNRSERRAVDELDSRSRPLYVLTPSLRVVRYAERALTEVIDLRERNYEWAEPVVVANAGASPVR